MRILPITTRFELDNFEHALNTGLQGQRNYTLFHLGRTSLLDPYLLLSLKTADVYTKDGRVKDTAVAYNKYSSSPQMLYLDASRQVLSTYWDWLQGYCPNSRYLFPTQDSVKTHGDAYMSMNTLNQILSKAAKKAGMVMSVGGQLMRKTGGYMIYQQTNQDIKTVTYLLGFDDYHHTMVFLGVEEQQKRKLLANIDLSVPILSPAPPFKSPHLNI